MKTDDLIGLALIGAFFGIMVSVALLSNVIKG
jgi:hypothetical protein